MKNNKGVTLIALTVTIIVLMIIASVATYSGIEALRDAKEEAQISEINMMKQAVVENYTKYQTTKDVMYLRGNILKYAEIISVINNLNSKSNTAVSLRAANYGNDLNELSEKKIEYYYELTNNDLSEMGVSQVEDVYIVNYKTGEVINKTLLTTRTGIPLYTYSIEENEKIGEITMSPSKTDSYVISQEVIINVPSTLNIQTLKYKWTNILNQPSISEFTENVPDTKIVNTPNGVYGNYYLWIYAKDIDGNEIIKSSGGYMINNMETGA